ncbi:hypothetical protein CHS0354_017572 [Potamilus streckersoni]|uniref:Uncharacterized protein n=1 Tax=Potamilus streckersoni TaxID=2493646 RepID=A0AAE0VGM2_9BIVA|nr:hypothetical protein CHS0354_017572 [Potamilus streckersoni]
MQDYQLKSVTCTKICSMEYQISECHVACQNGDCTRIQQLLDKFPFALHHIDSRGWTLAHYAALGDSQAMMKQLCKAGLDPHTRDIYGANILHLACLYGRVDLVKYLMKKYPKMYVQYDCYSWKSAHFAAQGGSVDTMRLFVETDTDFTLKDQYGANVLHLACGFGSYQLVEFLLLQFPELLHEVGENNGTAAHYAAQGGYVRVMELLVQHGVNLNSRTIHNMTVLHTACQHRNVEVVKYLLKINASLLGQSGLYNWNAAHFAAQGGSVDVLKLISVDVQMVRKRSIAGENILHIACLHGHYDMVKHILTLYPDMLDELGKYYWSAAHYAAKGGNVHIMELLVRHKLPKKTRSGMNANELHIACRYGHENMVQYLLDVMPFLSKEKGEHGWTSYHYAALGGSLRIMNMLAESGLDIRHEEESVMKVLEIASVHRDKEFEKNVKLLVEHTACV